MAFMGVQGVSRNKNILGRVTGCPKIVLEKGKMRGRISTVAYATKSYVKSWIFGKGGG